VHLCFHFFITAKAVTMHCFFKWTEGTEVARCEVRTVRWMWQDLELEVSNCL